MIELPEPMSLEGVCRVHVFVTPQPFVYLPGTYGGKYYFETGKDAKSVSDYVIGDSVIVNGLRFARDYWAVYAGQGQWEAVDNCFTFHNGTYYILSLTRNFITGMPGKKVNGVTVTRSQMRADLIAKMRNSTDPDVKSFNQILASFSLTK